MLSRQGIEAVPEFLLQSLADQLTDADIRFQGHYPEQLMERMGETDRQTCQALLSHEVDRTN